MRLDTMRTYLLFCGVYSNFLEKHVVGVLGVDK
jgi:hypothetical protein